MRGITLEQAAEAMRGELIGATDVTIEPTGGSLDNRTIEPGQLFFAIEGEQTDGHRYVDAAIEAGASAAIVLKDWIADNTANRPVIAVEAPDLALGDLAREYRKRFNIPVVGITGSNGKTTTKDMTAAVLGTRYQVLATSGNQNTRLGVPLTILQLEEEHEVAVIEMGISEHHGLTYLCEVADPTIGVITNIGPTHREF